MDDIKKLQDSIQAVRQQRQAYVDKKLGTAQTENDKIAKLAGTPGTKAELTFSDFQEIESRFNKPLSELKERLRLAEAEASKASIPSIESQLEAAKAAEREAADLHHQAEQRTKAAENRLNTALNIVEKSKETRSRITFQPRSRDLLDSTNDRQRNAWIVDKILNY